MGHVDDPGLIARIAAGDPDAFAALYDRYGASAYAHALRVTRDPWLAEEVVQDSFLNIWRQASRFDSTRGKPVSWLLSITHHKAVDTVRREQLRRADGAVPVVDAPDATNVPHEAWLALLGDQIRGVLADLSEVQRRVIELAYFEGCSQSEIADRLGEPLGTVKSRTQTALTRLRARLGELGIRSDSVWSNDTVTA